MSDDADLDAAMQAVVADMGEAAKKFKARRFAPKPVPAAVQAEEPAPVESESDMPTASELESMLQGA